MVASPAVVDSDFRYLDKKKGNLMRSRTELSIAQMLSFLNLEYEYDAVVGEDPRIRVDFRTESGLIEVIDGTEDIERYKAIKEAMPGQRIMAIGHPRYAAQIKELEEIVFYDRAPQTGSIFLEDPSFEFDYAHVLPLVEKCSILHGHTSSIMVELVGQMKDNLLIDFGEAKRIIRAEILGAFDHKFFINERYLRSQDGTHYRVGFEGPKGAFDLQVPKDTAYLLRGEATVENLATEMIRILSPKLPGNIEAVGVYIYEGYNKGSHIISRIARK